MYKSSSSPALTKWLPVGQACPQFVLLYSPANVSFQRVVGVSFCKDHQVSDKIVHGYGRATSKSLDHSRYGKHHFLWRFRFFLWLEAVKLEPKVRLVSWMDYASRGVKQGGGAASIVTHIPTKQMLYT